MSLDEIQLDKLQNFFKVHPAASIATISKEGRAHGSMIYFFTDDDLSFYFVTKTGTMKYQNIKNNNNVGLVISDMKNLETIQVEGVASEIPDPQKLMLAVSKVANSALSVGKNIIELPISRLKEGNLTLFKITPTWIRWIDFSQWESIVRLEHFFIHT